MKKIILSYLFVLVAAFAGAQETIKGDANNDNVVNSADVLEVEKAILGEQSPTGNYSAANADVNEDGFVNAADIVAIINIIEDGLTDKRLVVWKADGTKDRYELNDQPVTTFEGNSLAIRVSNNSRAFLIKDIVRYTYENTNSAGNDKETATVPANAQTPEAFYIYQNDGNFDGFFFDEVESIRYSKKDTLGFDHSKFVSQEIVTADSTYRFMLSAIDSVGFVQPEIRFSPKLKDMDKLGIRDYILFTGHNNYLENTNSVVTVRDDIPEALLPKVGDVLVGWDFDFYGEGGFGGKVKLILRNPDPGYQYIQLYCEDLTELSDVFEQFITTESVTVDNRGFVRSRLAGYHPEDDVFNSRAVTGDGDRDLINFSGTFKRVVSPVKDVSISLDTGVKVVSNIKVSYNISWSKVYVKLEHRNSVDISPSASVKISKEFEPIPLDFIPKFLKSIPFPAAAPIFSTHPLPEFILRGGGDLTAKLTFPNMNFHYNYSVVFNTDASPIMGFDYSIGYPLKAGSPVDPGDLELSLNGFLQAAVKLTFDINTSDWIQKIFGAGISINMFVGPKVEGSISLSAAKLLEGGGAYDMLYNSSIKAHACSVDMEALGQVSFLWEDPEQTTFFEKSDQFGTYETFLLPAFKESTATFRQMSREIKATVYPYRRTFMPATIGIGVYDYEDNQVAVEYFGKKYQQSDSTGITKYFSTKGMHSGHYVVRPIVQCLGIDMPVRGAEVEVYVPPFLVVGDSDHLDSIEVRKEGEKVEEFILTNVEPEKLTIDIQYEDNEGKISGAGTGDWIQASVTGFNKVKEEAWLKLDVKKNSTLFKRRSYVIVIANDGTGEYRDTLLVKQDPVFTVFKDGLGTVNAPVVQTSQGSGTDSDSGPYSSSNTYDTSLGFDVYSKWEVAQGQYKPFDITCSRTGDLITLRGSINVPGDLVETHGEDKPSSVWYYKRVTTGHRNMKWELVIDVSKRPGHLVSGTFDDDYTRTTSSIDKEWSYVSWDASRTYMTEQTSGTDSESWKTSFRWQKDIPCVKITENEDGGMMYFYLDRIHGSWCSVSMDWSSRFNSSKTTYDRDWDGKIHSHTVTASGTGTSTSAYKDDEDGGSVNIYLTY